MVPLRPSEDVTLAADTLGSDFDTVLAVYTGLLTTARVRWDDSQSPPLATWTNVSFLPTSLVTLDPILWTDPVTGRTFVAQLAGEVSIAAYTDDDGGRWVLTPLGRALLRP